MKTILCFGDSNTHGYRGEDGGRFDENQRWTKLLQRGLGEGYTVVEEGLCGRTTVFLDPLQVGARGMDYLIPCLSTHQPINLLVIMLGTNDTKERMSASAPCIGLGLRRLVEVAHHAPCWGEGGPNVLLIAPPPIEEGLYTSPVAGTMGVGCVEKSRQLAEVYRQVALETGCHFWDAGTLGHVFNEVDYMHLTAQGHEKMAVALAPKITELC